MAITAQLGRIGINSLYVMLNTASLAILQWIILAIIAHVDGPAALGDYALGQAFATPAAYLAWLSLRQQLIINETRDANFEDLLFLRAFVPLVVLSGSLLLVDGLYQNSELIKISAAVFAIRYFEGFFDLAYGRMQYLGDVRGVAQLALTRSIISIGFFVLIYIWCHNLTISLCAIVVAYLICYYVQRRRLILYPRNLSFFLADRDDLRRRLSISVHFFPFGVFVLLTSLTLSLPRMLVQEQLGAQQLGYFAAVFHFFAVGAIVVGSVGQTITPHFSKAIRESNEKQFWVLLALTSLIVFCACAIAAGAALFIGTPLIRLIYGPGFDGLGPLLCWAMISAGPIYIASLMTSALYAARAKGALVAIQIFVLLATGLLTMLLVVRFGVEGAFIASAFASVVQIIACGVSLIRFWQRHLESALFS